MFDMFKKRMSRIYRTEGEGNHEALQTNVASTSIASTSQDVADTKSTTGSGASRVSTAGRMNKDDIENFIGNDDRVAEHIESLHCKDENCGKLSDEDPHTHKVKRSLVQERMAHVTSGLTGIACSVVEYLLKLFISIRSDDAQGPIQGKFASSVNMRIHGIRLCQSCFAASYHMLKPDGQYKSTWVQARQLFCQGFTEAPQTCWCPHGEHIPFIV